MTKKKIIEEKRRKSTDPAGIKDIISAVIGKLDEDDVKGKGKIFLYWKKIVGEKLSHHTRPLKIRAKTLTVVVDSSAWLFELENQYKEMIIKKIDHILGADLIKDIIFKVGEIKVNEL